MAIDHVLKLYSEIIRSDYLHYGFWDQPDTVDIESITIQEIKNAQGRYIEHLVSYIPEGVKSILDVGCGIGGNANYLVNKGYSVETLSPDDFQKSAIVKKFNNQMTFHHCKFEKFRSKKKYDLLLESESACYISIDKGFEKAKEVIKNGGYLLASDYFVYYRDDSNSLHLKSSHDMEKYLSSAKTNGFELIKEYDQTENTMPTLDYGKHFIDRFINPTVEYSVHSAKKTYPIISALIGKLLAKKFERKRSQLDLIDKNLFKKYRRYMIYLFQNKNDSI